MAKNKPKTYKLYFVIMALFMFIAVHSFANRQNPTSNTKTHANIDEFEKEYTPTEQTDTNVSFANVGRPDLDSVVLEAQAQHQVFAVAHQKRTFTQQYYSSIIIFIMVLAIVVMGLILSYKQFKLNEEIVRHSIKEKRENIDNGTNTEASLEVGKDGIKMNTAVIGLMILAISLVFFFLYLRFVYHIEVMPE